MERYRRIFLSVAAAVTSRGVGLAVSLITVPLLLGYFGVETYGLWVAITALVAWATLFDFGMVNSLVNAVSEANGRNDRDAARRYVATAFFVLSGIALVMGIAFLLAMPFVPWEAVFAAEGLVDPRILRLAVLAAVGCFAIGLPLSIVRQVYAGYQLAYFGSIVSIVGSLLTLAGIVTVIRLGGGLPAVILTYGGINLLLLTGNLVFLTRRQMPWLKLHPRFFERVALRRLLRVSSPLFLYQIGALMVNQSQVLILAHRADLETVTSYSLITQIYLGVIGIVAMSTQAFVPTFREAFERGDHGWMRASFRRMLAIRTILATGAGVLLILWGNDLMRIWLGRTDIAFPLLAWVVLALLLVGSAWTSAFTDLLTIMDRIWVLVGLVLINGLAAVGLTYLLAPAYGVVGALIALSVVTIVAWTWLLPVLARRIVWRHVSE